jgi:hypothetical protein
MNGINLSTAFHRLGRCSQKLQGRQAPQQRSRDLGGSDIVFSLASNMELNTKLVDPTEND